MYSSTRHVLLAAFSCLVVLSLSSCSSGDDVGDGGVPTGSVISGTVTAPGGVVAFLQKPKAINLFLSDEAYAAIAGSAPVPDGTIVQLGHIAKAPPFAFSAVSSTTTASGRYSFNLTSLGLQFKNDLVIRVVGTGNSEMRAFATSQNVDLNPGSELAVRLALEQIGTAASATLDRFTLQEINDLSASLNLLIGARTFTGGIDLEAAIAVIRGAVLTDATLLAFISDAANEGQTSLGPGDQGNYFPTTFGSTWGYQTTRKETGKPTIVFNTGRSVSGSRVAGGITETVFYETNPSNSGIPEEDYFLKDGIGVANRGTSDSTDPITPLLVPYYEVRFPLQTGHTFEQIKRTIPGIPLDIDGDGRDETVNVSSTTRVVGFETVTVPAGNFANSAKMETRISTNFILTGGGSVLVTGTETFWLAPGIGLVKRITVVQSRGIRETNVEELVSYSIEGQANGTGSFSFPIATGVSPANSDYLRPGKSGLATDGTNYLLVSCRDLGTPTGLFGVFVTSGVARPGFPIVTGNCQAGLGVPVVSFDGTNYLIVFFKDQLLKGIRVSQSGTVLDGPDGFAISTLAHWPSIAYDGSNYLITYGKFVGNDGSYDLYGTRVSPSGQVLGEFPISTATGAQILPEIAFNGANYLVVWDDRRNGQDDIFGARVTPGGVVLDLVGIPISTTASFETWPRIAFDGANYLVVWTKGLATGSDPAPSEIRGMRVNSNGALLDGTSNNGGFGINTLVIGKSEPAIVFDGTNFLVSWVVGSFSNNGELAGIYGARVAPTGQVVEGLPSTVGISLSPPPPPFSRFRWPITVSNSSSTMITWVNNIELQGMAKSIEGTIIFH